MSVFEATGLFGVLIVFAVWATRLGRSLDAPRTFALLTVLALGGGGVSVVLATSTAAAAIGTVARAVTFGWALGVAVCSLADQWRRNGPPVATTDDPLQREAWPPSRRSSSS
ncbi:MAG TPA: hypothetical protein RMH99_01930 [Sandaracinaceae bacterium LLY-WYZ-13_1]|nr:hypothetical protein [Sandaracinaceae bacterium LLY-WYZ-13_1]